MEKNDIKQALKDVREFEHIGSFIMGVVMVVILSGGVIYGLAKLKFHPFSFRATTDSSSQVTPSVSITELKQLPSSPDLYQKNGQWYVHNLPAIYEVKGGDSSWKVALAVYGSGDNYRDIESENHMKSNQDLVVGQKITLPNVPSKKLGAAITVQPSATVVPSSTPNPTSTVQPSATPQQTATPAVSPQAGDVILPTKHVVQKSEGLWQIAQKYYHDGYKYMKIYEANKDKMKSPEDVYVGLELTIPAL